MILNLMRRVFNAEAVNAIANHAEVRPWLGGRGELDFSAVAGNTDNICFLAEGAAFVCHKIGDGRYEVHSMALPSARGGFAIECVREGLRYMFCATDCVELVTRCPDGNRAALGFAREAGFQEIFRREACFDAGGEEPIGASYQSMTLDRWRGRDPVIASYGERFHEVISASDMGAAFIAHADDEAHDRAVGASMLMVLAGNPRKGVWAYNRWAIFAGYGSISLISEAPLVIDAAGVLVGPRGGEMEVLLCRELLSPPLSPLSPLAP